VNTGVETPTYGSRGFTFGPVVSIEPSHGGQVLYQSPAREFSPPQNIALRSARIGDLFSGFAVGLPELLSPQLRQRIREFADLKMNWDGEGAKPVRPSVLADAIGVLWHLAVHCGDFRDPFLAPTFDGFVQIEWHSDKRSLDIEATSEGWCVVGTLLGKDGARHYYTEECGRSDFDRLRGYYEWFVGVELLWPLP